jgi:pimeloyl-ACP methyl ester carboxylesterase
MGGGRTLHVYDTGGDDARAQIAVFLVDDLLAYVAPWGFDPGQVRAPVLFLHGDQDRVVPCSHSEWLARRSRSGELWLRPDAGHISVLDSGVAALDWLREHA